MNPPGHSNIEALAYCYTLYLYINRKEIKPPC